MLRVCPDAKKALCFSNRAIMVLCLVSSIEILLDARGHQKNRVKLRNIFLTPFLYAFPV